MRAHGPAPDRAREAMATMATMATMAPSAQVQHARTLLAAIAEQATHQRGHTAHLHLLRALDGLEDAALDPWPPPDEPSGTTGLTSALNTALNEVRVCLRAVLGDPDRHRVDPLRLALAVDHITHTLTALNPDQDGRR